MVKCGTGTKRAEGEREYFNSISSPPGNGSSRDQQPRGKVGSDGRSVLSTHAVLPITPKRGAAGSVGKPKGLQLADTAQAEPISAPWPGGAWAKRRLA